MWGTDIWVVSRTNYLYITEIQHSYPSPSAHSQTSATPLELRKIATMDAQFGLIMDTTMKMGERETIPSILLHQDKTRSDVLAAAEMHTVNGCVMNTVANETAAKDPLFSLAKTLKRKKRLSLKGIYIANSSSLAPPERSPPLSPPPENLQPPSSSLATLTPPGSPSDTCQTPSKNILPTIVISTPTSTTLVLLEPSQPVPPMATSSPHPLPRIGTPQRPYYSTVRAHLRQMQETTQVSVSRPCLHHRRHLAL